jgi:hypothetical protein
MLQDHETLQAHVQIVEVPVQTSDAFTTQVRAFDESQLPDGRTFDSIATTLSQFGKPITSTAASFENSEDEDDDPQAGAVSQAPINIANAIAPLSGNLRGAREIVGMYAISPWPRCAGFCGLRIGVVLRNGSHGGMHGHKRSS